MPMVHRGLALCGGSDPHNPKEIPVRKILTATVVLMLALAACTTQSTITPADQAALGDAASTDLVVAEPAAPERGERVEAVDPGAQAYAEDTSESETASATDTFDDDDDSLFEEVDGIDPCSYVDPATVTQLLGGDYDATGYELLGEPQCDFYGPEGFEGRWFTIFELEADNVDWRWNSTDDIVIINGVNVEFVTDGDNIEIGVKGLPIDNGRFGGFWVPYHANPGDDMVAARALMEQLAAEILTNRS
jgi:hypothetical protein